MSIIALTNEDILALGLCTPSQVVHLNPNLLGTFGRHETEVAAKSVVHVCLQKEGWEPFKIEDVQGMHRKLGYRGEFHFNGLLDPVYMGTSSIFTGPTGGGYIVRRGKLFVVTLEFIRRVSRNTR